MHVHMGRAWLKCDVSFFLAFLARSLASREAAAAAALLAPFFAAAAAFFRASAFFACPAHNSIEHHTHALQQHRTRLNMGQQVSRLLGHASGGK